MFEKLKNLFVGNRLNKLELEVIKQAADSIDAKIKQTVLQLQVDLKTIQKRGLGD